MSRYISNTPEQQLEMLNAVGLKTTEELFQDIPQEMRLKRTLNLPSLFRKWN